jgi:hypothetical protein
MLLAAFDRFVGAHLHFVLDVVDVGKAAVASF